MEIFLQPLLVFYYVLFSVYGVEKIAILMHRTGRLCAKTPTLGMIDSNDESSISSIAILKLIIGIKQFVIVHLKQSTKSKVFLKF